MLKVLLPELTGAPHHASPCLPSQGFPFVGLSFLADLLKTCSKCSVWTQALAADGSRTSGMPVGVPRAGSRLLVGLHPRPGLREKLGLACRDAPAPPQLCSEG